jgi:hypothetical protein
MRAWSCPCLVWLCLAACKRDGTLTADNRGVTSQAKAPSDAEDGRDGASDAEALDATLDAAVDADAAVETVDPCAGRDASTARFDVFLRFSRGGQAGMVSMTLTVPARKVRVDLGALGGPFNCSAGVTDAGLAWSCMEDLGAFKGEARIAGDSLVVREGPDEDRDQLLFRLPSVDGSPASSPRPANPMRETHRVPWPCGARAVFHSADYSTVPKD